MAVENCYGVTENCREAKSLILDPTEILGLDYQPGLLTAKSVLLRATPALLLPSGEIWACIPQHDSAVPLALGQRASPDVDHLADPSTFSCTLEQPVEEQ